MTTRATAALLCLAVAVATAAHAQKGPTAAKQVAEDRAFLRQLAESQRGLGEQLQELKETVDALRGQLAGQQEKEDALEQEVKAMREEVKGLYVESSSVKQEIAAVRDDVGGVDSNVSGLRGYSSFFLAVMLVSLVLIFFLVLRR